MILRKKWISLFFHKWASNLLFTFSYFYESHFLGRILICAYRIWLDVQTSEILHSSSRSTFPTQLCISLNSFCANLMWLTLSSLLPQVYTLFYSVVSISTFILLVITVSSCGAIKRDLVFLLQFSFLSHDLVISWVISPVTWRIHTAVFLIFFLNEVVLVCSLMLI